jgi:5-methylcytosine-specific restriction protein B
MGYYHQLKQFLSEAKTDNLKTKHYDSEYLGMEVKVSFGQGTVAQIPWISFLKEPNTTSKGIYPVYLYYKDFEILILAYGISETNKPITSWDSNGKQTIFEYFEEHFSQKPYRYGGSYIYKVYDVNNFPAEETIENDLNTIVEEYLGIENSHLVGNHAKFVLDTFKEALTKSGLLYSHKLIVQFVSSLLTKPFVILTGLSGSGKTKLAQAFVQWICQDKNQYRVIPVGADWTNREPLLGYPNALKPEEYVKPDSGVLDLIIEANQHPDLPYFLMLDEMNLSHVERYFADFLSVMESKEEIPLYTENTENTVQNRVPARLRVPPNLFIIGTVNIDETTNMFSPKVLDRANTIEFRVTEKEMEGFLTNIKEIDMKALNAKGTDMAGSFLQMTENKSFATIDVKEINTTLVKFFGELKKTGAEFGYRSATEILRLINQLTVLDNTLSTNQKLDIAIMQKLLPKLHGSRRKLCPVLEVLGSFCVDGGIKVIKDVFEKDDFEFNQNNVRYPLSLEKITRMYKGAIDNGFASFAEA